MLRVSKIPDQTYVKPSRQRAFSIAFQQDVDAAISVLASAPELPDYSLRSPCCTRRKLQLNLRTPLAMHETQAGLHIIYRDREQTDQGGGFIAQVTIGMALT